MAGKSLFEQIQDGITHAITDIREKLVEEPWWGRSLSDTSSEDQAGPRRPRLNRPAATRMRSSRRMNASAGWTFKTALYSHFPAF